MKWKTLVCPEIKCMLEISSEILCKYGVQFKEKTKNNNNTVEDYEDEDEESKYEGIKNNDFLNDNNNSLNIEDAPDKIKLLLYQKCEDENTQVDLIYSNYSD